MASTYPDPREYVQVAAAVRKQITEGSLIPGQPVPITELCRLHGCCRQTASKGLRILEREGLLCRVRGLSYHVSSESLRLLAVPPRQRPPGR
jgi:DNA-binding GntR family transcriptional regulator